MTTRATLEILHSLHAEHLRLADKASLHKHAAGVVRHTRTARAIAEAIKVMQLAQAPATAGAFDPLPCADGTDVIGRYGDNGATAGNRDWWTGGVWLYPGQVVAVIAESDPAQGGGAGRPPAWQPKGAQPGHSVV